MRTTLLSKYKNELINNFKIQIKVLKKEKIILSIENLILQLNKKGLIMGLFTIEKFKIETSIFSMEELNKIINKIALDLVEKNSILFKLELYMPKLYEFTLEQLLVWIYKVEIKEEKIKKDDKKQFFYLILKFQKANEEEKSIILIELLYKIQLYIKHAK